LAILLEETWKIGRNTELRKSCFSEWKEKRRCQVSSTHSTHARM